VIAVFQFEIKKKKGKKEKKEMGMID